eukprot:6756997-Ditylum_brightwellii.AAC.1
MVVATEHWLTWISSLCAKGCQSIYLVGKTAWIQDTNIGYRRQCRSFLLRLTFGLGQTSSWGVASGRKLFGVWQDQDFN